MKKKASICILSVCVLLCGLALLVSCGEGSGDDLPTTAAVKLTSPVVSLNGDTATWSAEPLADKFEVSIDGNLSYIENSVTSKKLNEGQTFKIRAIGDGIRYTSSDWSNAVTYTVSAPPTGGETFTVTWKNGDVVLEIDSGVAKGSFPMYDGQTPTKEADARYTYIFSGWTPTLSAVMGNVTYTALFTPMERTYTVTWKNGESTLEVDTGVAYGTIPTYNGETPEKAATAQYTYVFKGWTPSVSAVTKDVTYSAEYESVLNRYTVTYYDETGTVILDTFAVYYGHAAEYTKATPTKSATEGHTYIFDRWATSQGADGTELLSFVTGNTVVYASFRDIVRQVSVYVVTNNTDYGTVSVSILNNVAYGAAIEVNGNTVSIAGQTVVAQANSRTPEYSYTFDGWTADSSVGNDTIITANFSRSINTYTVTWKNGDETLETDEQVRYGAMPTYNGQQPEKPSDSAYIYLFSGWSPSISAVTGDVTYTAQFTNETNVHTVVFYNEDGSIELGRAVVAHGVAAVYPNASPEKEPNAQYIYRFEKWVTSVGGDTEADLTAVTENRAVYVKYTAEERLYNVKFTDWNGTTLKEESVRYGQSATAPQDPHRDGYRFVSWSGTYSNIVGDTDVLATYVRQYTVTFVDYDDSIIDIQLIDSGCDAEQPEDPSRIQYTFTGWDTTFTEVFSDLTVRAQYVRQYIVTFKDYDGTILFTDMVDGGESATAPENPEREGYAFVSWSRAFANVTEDIEVVAVYQIKRYTVTFLGKDGTVLQSITGVAHGSGVVPPSVEDVYFDWNRTKGYRFTGWGNWTEGMQIVEDVEIQATYNEEITEPILAIESVEITKGTTGAKISVYLCGSMESMYGLSLGVNFEFAKAFDAFSAESHLSGSESTLDTRDGTYEVSWASGEGMTVNGTQKLLTITFEIDKYQDAGVYILEMMEGAYLIDKDMQKITPVIIVGQLEITE